MPGFLLKKIDPSVSNIPRISQLTLSCDKIIVGMEMLELFLPKGKPKFMNALKSLFDLNSILKSL